MSRCTIPARCAWSSGLRHRAEQAQRLGRLDPSGFADHGVERAALDELHHQEVVADVEDAHDLRVVEAAGGDGLAAEALQVLGGRVAREQLGLDGLDRDDARDLRIPGGVHPPHGAVADLGEDFVASKPLGKHDGQEAAPRRGPRHDSRVPAYWWALAYSTWASVSAARAGWGSRSLGPCRGPRRRPAASPRAASASDSRYSPAAVAAAAGGRPPPATSARARSSSCCSSRCGVFARRPSARCASAW